MNKEKDISLKLKKRNVAFETIKDVGTSIGVFILLDALTLDKLSDFYKRKDQSRAVVLYSVFAVGIGVASYIKNTKHNREVDELTQEIKDAIKKSIERHASNEQASNLTTQQNDSFTQRLEQEKAGRAASSTSLHSL